MSKNKREFTSKDIYDQIARYQVVGMHELNPNLEVDE